MNIESRQSGLEPVSSLHQALTPLSVTVQPSRNSVTPLENETFIDYPKAPDRYPPVESLSLSSSSQLHPFSSLQPSNLDSYHSVLEPVSALMSNSFTEDQTGGHIISHANTANVLSSGFRDLSDHGNETKDPFHAQDGSLVFYGAPATEEEIKMYNAILDDSDQSNLPAEDACDGNDPIEQCDGLEKCPVETCGLLFFPEPTTWDASMSEIGPNGKPLSVEAMKHKCQFRFRCVCGEDFCLSCKAVPYHLGKTCTEFAFQEDTIACRFCEESIEDTSLIQSILLSRRTFESTITPQQLSTICAQNSSMADLLEEKKTLLTNSCQTLGYWGYYLDKSKHRAAMPFLFQPTNAQLNGMKEKIRSSSFDCAKSLIFFEFVDGEYMSQDDASQILERYFSFTDVFSSVQRALQSPFYAKYDLLRLCISQLRYARDVGVSMKHIFENNASIWVKPSMYLWLSCAADECTRMSSNSCQFSFPCGHFCCGARSSEECALRRLVKPGTTSPDQHVGGNLSHFGCLRPNCEYQFGFPQLPHLTPRGSDVTFDDYCSVCYTQSLGSAPCVRLKCSHIMHLHCLNSFFDTGDSQDSKSQLSIFNFEKYQCPSCKQFIQTTIPEFQANLDTYVSFRKTLIQDGVRRIPIQLLDPSKEISNPESRFYQKPDEFIAQKANYYRCSKCSSYYFAGLKSCGEAENGNNLNNIPIDHYLCQSCSFVPGRSKTCSTHGVEYMVYKCRYCCKEASWFCFGSVHYCDSCHALQNRGKTPPNIPCPQAYNYRAASGGKGKRLRITSNLEETGKCPLKIPHPPPGTEFVIGCSACVNSTVPK